MSVLKGAKKAGFLGACCVCGITWVCQRAKAYVLTLLLNVAELLRAVCGGNEVRRAKRKPNCQLKILRVAKNPLTLFENIRYKNMVEITVNKSVVEFSS